MSIHNPSSFEPSHYSVEAYLDNQRPKPFAWHGAIDIAALEDYRREVEHWEAEMRAVLGPDWMRKKNHCIHCGNGNVRWITAVRHEPTGEVVVFGSDCTHRLQFKNRDEFKLAQLKARAEARSARTKVILARAAFLNDHPEIVAAFAAMQRPEHQRNAFVADVLGKLNQYGSISPAQIQAVQASLERDLQRVKEDAEPKGDAPEGRVEVTGVVLSIKPRETDFGTVLKMLMKLDNNSKVWMTAPAGTTYQSGDRITVAATFERSKDDRSFAFGKRPRFIRAHHQGVTP